MQGLVALVVVSLLAGVLACRTGRFPVQTPDALNALVLNVALPALVLRSLHRVQLDAGLAFGAAMLWLQFLLALGVFALVGRWARMSRGTIGALALTAGLSNTAFVGLPVIEATLGPVALGPAVFVDQLGSFLLVCSLAMAVAAGAAGQKVSLGRVVRKVLFFPAFIALVVALLLRPLPIPGWVDDTLLRLGALLTPLALFSVGFQLQWQGARDRLGPLCAGLGYKLVLSPLVFGALMLLFEPWGSVTWKVTVLQCAMPPMVTGGILASQYQLDPPLAAAMVGLGIPVAAGTLALIFLSFG